MFFILVTKIKDYSQGHFVLFGVKRGIKLPTFKLADNFSLSQNTLFFKFGL